MVKSPSSLFKLSTRLRHTLIGSKIVIDSPLSTPSAPPAAVWMKARGGVLQSTDDLSTIFAQQRSFYAGFDPTASSLHLGNLVSLVAMCGLAQFGHKPVVVLGGATALIGDPSGRDSERPLLPPEQIESHIRNLSSQISRVFSNCNIEVTVLNNYDWIGKMSITEFLRGVGKEFRVGSMLARDSVKNRLEGGGLSFTEFSYQLLQAYDFLHLRQTHNVSVQLGGSDQWGNIVSGCELIRRKEGKDAFGVTLPLLLTASGKKFGKSAGNAIWIDENLTTSFQLHQYLLNTADSEIKPLLEMLTLLPTTTIAEILAEHEKNPEQRLAQTQLADAVLALVHGTPAVQKVHRLKDIMFGQGLPDAETARALEKECVSTRVPAASVEGGGLSVAPLLVNAKLCSSNAEFRRLVQSGGFYINEERSNSLHLQASHFTNGVCSLRVGKKNKIFVFLE